MMLSLLVLGEMSREIPAPDLRALLASVRDSGDTPETVVCNASRLLGSGGRPAAHLERLFDSGIDVVVLDAKSLARPATREVLGTLRRVIRPLNLPPGTPGAADLLLETPTGACRFVALETGDDRMPVDPPWETLAAFEAGLTDRAPLVLLFTGSDLELKQAMAWRVQSLSRPVHLIGTGLGCMAGHPMIRTGRASVPDVGIAAGETTVSGIAPDVWWQRQAHLQGAPALPPDRLLIDAIRLRLDDAGRAASIERLRFGV